ncbi:hypothetical protein ACHQM5_025418 [Ranunculus cassubicifolius]
MADALITVLLEQLSSYIQSEVALVIDTREEVVKLTGNLKLVQAVLADADEKQVKKEVVRVWLDNLKQVVYDADDVLDEWRTRTAISQLQGSINVGTRKKVLSYLLSPCFCFQNVIVRYDIGQNIRDINTRLDGIAKQRTDFGLEVVHQIEPRPQTSSVVDVSKIHGRDRAKEEIVSRLLGESSSQGEALRVIAIVGIGGLGKTSLAKMILNEERVNANFKTKMWVCVSEPFNLGSVAKAIIKEATGDGQESAEWEEVHRCLCQSVKGKQFLLVLDDVWTEDPNHWSQLKLALAGGAPGSRIIVTTRNRTVAKMMGSSDFDVHDLENLSNDDSWLVLRDVALVGKEKEEKFEKIGREIAIKCKGVPLAITTLASLLYERQTKQEWKKVLASDLWEMPQIEQFFLPSLFLSYYSLPPISKQCFLYSAVFPKDTELQKVVLIRLWMAQGFFGFEERKDLERSGEDHFHILAMRSFFQDFKKDFDGNITSCKMHDLVHDFAIYLLQNECSYLEAGDAIFDSEKIRHVYANDFQNPSIVKARKMRTFICKLATAIPSELFTKLACLRTLVLRGSLLEVLPKEVENLLHLRYLELSDSELLELPETLCNLYNLQVLGLNWCRKLHKLPKKIGKLSNLRHLEIERTDGLSYFPKSIAALRSLRTLSKFIVSDAGHGCKIGDLQRLNNLQGALELEGLSRVTDEKDVVRAELKKKVNLRQLSFCFKKESGFSIGMKNVLEKLEPHEDLEVLEIRDYPDSQFPSWVQSCSVLTNIVEMSLSECNQCTQLPAFGKLAFLQSLKIKGMSSVTRIGSEFYGFGARMTVFPKLKSLVILDMERLEEWELPVSKDTKIMPLLSKIILEKCPMLRALPCLGSLESLKKLSLSRLPSVTHIGHEFFGFDAQMMAFPKLDSLVIEDMEKLEEWELLTSKDTEIMPLLVELNLEKCPMLRALPCLGSLESLENLSMEALPSVKYMGDEFYGFGADSSLGVEMITFPKLKTLEMKKFDELEEWEIPISKNRKIMPLLSELELNRCKKLRALPRVWKMRESLEVLKLGWLDSVEGVGVEFVGNDNEGSLQDEVTFPKLRELAIRGMPKLKVWSVPLITPCLVKLELYGFPKLKKLPTFQECMKTLEDLEIAGMGEWEGQEKIVINDEKGGGDSCGLRSLFIGVCPKLSVVPDYMFSPSLRVLTLDSDVGVLFDSFPADASLCSITKVSLWSQQHSSLPKGFDLLKALQSIEFNCCSTLDFDLKEFARHFTMLRNLEIFNCPLLAQRFKGDDWRTILAHVPTIEIV